MSDLIKTIEDIQAEETEERLPEVEPYPVGNIHCPVCGTEKPRFTNRFGPTIISFPLPCVNGCKEEDPDPQAGQARAEARAVEMRNKAYNNFGPAGSNAIHTDWWGKTWADFERTDASERAVARAREFVRDLKAYPNLIQADRSRLLHIQGNPKAGKTVVAAITANEALAAGISTGFANGRMLPFLTREQINNLTACRLIVIDDVGDHANGSFSKEQARVVYKEIVDRVQQNGAKAIIQTGEWSVREMLLGRFLAPEEIGKDDPEGSVEKSSIFWRLKKLANGAGAARIGKPFDSKRRER